MESESFHEQPVAPGTEDQQGPPRRWVIDSQDQEVAVPLGAYGDAIPRERREIYTPNQFRENPAYIGGDRLTEPMGHTTAGRGKDVLPDKFAGKVPWSDYRRHFEVCMYMNGWTNVQAGQYLASRLQGPALKVLSNILPGREITYVELTSLLERRFGPGEQAENFMYELRMRRRQPRESLQELGQSIRDLTCLAYPELAADVRERLAKGHFLDAIDDAEIRAGIFRSQPSTLDQAIKAGLMTESFIRAEKSRERTRPTSRQVRAIDERVQPVPMDDKTRKEIDEMKMKMNELMNMMKNVNFESRRAHVTCFNCGEPGHYSKECTKPFQGNERRPTQWGMGRSGKKGPQA